MKTKYATPILCALALLAGEVGSHFDRFLHLMPPGISERVLRARLRIEAPAIELRTVITAMSKKHHVKEAFIKSIIRAESGFKPEVVSNKGAIGLMQLMPETAQDLGADPRVPEQNVEAGTKYLGQLLYRYRNHKDAMVRAIAAYNAGPGWVDKYKGVPPFAETKAYVKRVLTYYHQYGGEPVILAASAKTKRANRTHRPARRQSDETTLAD